MNYFDFPLEEWTNWFIDNFFLPVFGSLFDALGGFFEAVLSNFTSFFLWIPAEILTLVLVIIAWRWASRGLALFTLLGMLYIGSVDVWPEAMQTLAIVLVATILSIAIGIPIGIWCAKSNKVDKVVRPILDFMQTLPSFVYLIPVILLLGIGGVSAVFATFIYATPPAVRLTNLAIRQVPSDVVEAARAFGSTSWQMLRKVQPVYSTYRSMSPFLRASVRTVSEPSPGFTSTSRSVLASIISATRWVKIHCSVQSFPETTTLPESAWFPQAVSKRIKKRKTGKRNFRMV